MIDQNEAPEGYVAIEYVSCDECALQHGPERRTSPRMWIRRADETEAQFTLKEKK